MYIRKRSFFEIVLPFTITSFVCLGTYLINPLHPEQLRWVMDTLLFFYLFLNKKLLIYINGWFKAVLLIYLVWCILTTAWSEIPIFSFSKSTLFAFNIIIMLSAGSLWMIKYGYERSFDWLYLVLIVALLSGFLGGASTGHIQNSPIYYAGLSGNPNGFGFLMAIISPLIFWKLYQKKNNKWLFLIWFCILILDVYFLVSSYSRSSLAIFVCILCLFTTSLPLSKKIIIMLSSFFCMIIFLMITPINYLEIFIANHISKSHFGTTDINEKIVFSSRELIWKKTYQRAKQGGIIGGGFAVTIGGKNFSIKQLSGTGIYGGEKGNAQLAIMEETGIIGLAFYAIILFSFFAYIIPRYIRLKSPGKIAMSLVLGAILGLLIESIVEAWWDSAAGQELICFWTLAGMMYGMVHLEKRKLRHQHMNTEIEPTLSPKNGVETLP